MNRYLGMAVVAILCCFCVIGGWAAAADTVRVPHSLVEEGDVGLRQALKDYSPNYDELSRGSQVFSYVHVYKWRHDGKMPQLSAEDAALLPASSPGVETHPSDVVDVDSIHIGDDTTHTNESSSFDWFDSPRLNPGI